MNITATTSFTLATAALLFACSSESNEATGNKSQSALVKCEGVNECKGTSECKSATNPNGCQGLNECKGKGYITISKEECDAKGGKLAADAPPAVTGDAPPAATGDAPPATGTKTLAVKCEGINECKGTSECAGAENECKGKNECKGHGYIQVPSEAECVEKGGKVKA